MDAHGAVSPYALLYYGTHSDKWHRHSIITDHIRSMRIKSGIVEIDTKWWDGPNPD